MRALAKASVQTLFGRVPGGPHLYRTITRARMGTQATHIDKMAKAWGGYAPFWASHGVDLNGAQIWMHDGGWTPYPNILMFLLTGCGGHVTMWEGALMDRYVEKAIDFGLKQEFPGIQIPPDRIARLESLRGATAYDLVSRLDGQWTTKNRVHPALPKESIDLLVSGGVLEHFLPEELDQFLAHSRTILKPRGWASHVFDMRDHLYHADKALPFLNHLRFSDNAYDLRYGHRLGYHNRLLPGQIREKIEVAGFEVVCMRRLVLPAAKYIEDPEPLQDAKAGLNREDLAPRFRSATDEDLRTAALHLLCRVRA